MEYCALMISVFLLLFLNQSHTQMIKRTAEHNYYLSSLCGECELLIKQAERILTSSLPQITTQI